MQTLAHYIHHITTDSTEAKHVNGFSVCNSQSGNFLTLFYQNVNRFGTKEIQSHDVSHMEEFVREYGAEDEVKGE
jgi:hypothetical protein